MFNSLIGKAKEYTEKKYGFTEQNNILDSEGSILTCLPYTCFLTYIHTYLSNLAFPKDLPAAVAALFACFVLLGPTDGPRVVFAMPERCM
jgi:hypothetical protein